MRYQNEVEFLINRCFVHAIHSTPIHLNITIHIIVAVASTHNLNRHEYFFIALIREKKTEEHKRAVMHTMVTPMTKYTQLLHRHIFT